MSWLERIHSRLVRKPIRADAAAALTLTLLWAFYFWRVLTPNPLDQVSLPQGDYSGQFVAFGAYQARRLLAGQIPLWNPYNYAGLPFIADTQAAVFYPPRLVTILLSHLFGGGWSYAALQVETIAHVWLASLFMYLFVRTVTCSRIAGLVGGITLAYGGYLSGYPPLQLAVLEAGIWLPVGLLGIYKASVGSSDDKAQLATSPPHPATWNVRWLALTASALGISLLAGHPQTSLFISYTLIAYTIHRAVKQGLGWRSTGKVLLATLGLGYGLAAVQVLPGLEYTRLTIRADYGFDALGGGFPFSDLLTILLPNVLTVWSPLYNGIAPLVLALVAITQRQEAARFWGAWALLALGLSFGGATVLYRLAYLLVPGFALFRGQERAAYLIAHSVAILAGLGTVALRSSGAASGRLVRRLGIAAGLAWLLAIEVFVVDQALAEAHLFELLKATALLGLLATLTWVVIGRLGQVADRAWWSLALLGLIVFDLFSVTMGTNWEPIPVSRRELLSDLVPVVLEDRSLFRVDGRLGLGENYGTMVGLQDIRGTSPLRLAALDRYLTMLPQYRYHQLLAVKYVFTDWQQLEVPSTVRAKLTDQSPPLFLHEIVDPLPRAWMAYRVMVAPDDFQALGWLADPAFDPRSTVILNRDPQLDLPLETPVDWEVVVEDYAPERVVLEVSTPADGVLVISEMDYPGWQAMVDGSRADIWHADAGLRALPLAKGQHRIEMTYRPLSVQIGAAISLCSVLILILMGNGIVGRSRRGQ